MRVLRARGPKAHGLTVPARKGCPSGHDLAIAADLPVRDRALVIVVTARAKAHALVTVIEIVVKDRVLVIVGDRGGGRFGGRGRGPRGRKICSFCVDHVIEIDYKDVSRLHRYLSDRGKIEPRRKTGTCARHQRRLGVALKNARHMALLPYTAAHRRGA